MWFSTPLVATTALETYSCCSMRWTECARAGIGFGSCASRRIASTGREITRTGGEDYVASTSMFDSAFLLSLVLACPCRSLPGMFEHAADISLKDRARAQSRLVCPWRGCARTYTNGPLDLALGRGLDSLHTPVCAVPPSCSTPRLENNTVDCSRHEVTRAVASLDLSYPAVPCSVRLSPNPRPLLALHNTRLAPSNAGSQPILRALPRSLDTTAPHLSPRAIAYSPFYAAALQGVRLPSEKCPSPSRSTSYPAPPALRTLQTCSPSAPQYRPSARLFHAPSLPPTPSHDPRPVAGPPSSSPLAHPSMYRVVFASQRAHLFIRRNAHLSNRCSAPPPPIRHSDCAPRRT